MSIPTGLFATLIMLRYIEYGAELRAVILVVKVDSSKPQPSVPHFRDWGRWLRHRRCAGSVRWDPQGNVGCTDAMRIKKIVMSRASQHPNKPL
jgi:hypothetical protein